MRRIELKNRECYKLFLIILEKGLNILIMVN